MGLLDMVEQVAGGSNNADHARVAGGLLEELQQHPGGIGGLLQSLQQNGSGGLVQQWSNGQTQPANPTDMESGLQGTGMIDKIAQRTGLSPTVVKTGLAVTLPILIHHMTANNHVTPTGEMTGNQPAPHDLLSAVMGRLL
ncbi:DUF937 domain-containing protein [Acidobacteria bacterium AB60]|nr:DUF937 domain-containing protein [Acidobacteria bacterium AB60]